MLLLLPTTKRSKIFIAVAHAEEKDVCTTDREEEKNIYCCHLYREQKYLLLLIVTNHEEEKNIYCCCLSGGK